MTQPSPTPTYPAPFEAAFGQVLQLVVGVGTDLLMGGEFFVSLRADRTGQAARAARQRRPGRSARSTRSVRLPQVTGAEQAVRRRVAREEVQAATLRIFDPQIAAVLVQADEFDALAVKVDEACTTLRSTPEEVLRAAAGIRTLRDRDIQSIAAVMCARVDWVHDPDSAMAWAAPAARAAHTRLRDAHPATPGQQPGPEPRPTAPRQPSHGSRQRAAVAFPRATQPAGRSSDAVGSRRPEQAARRQTGRPPAPARQGRVDTTAAEDILGRLLNPVMVRQLRDRGYFATLASNLTAAATTLACPPEAVLREAAQLTGLNVSGPTTPGEATIAFQQLSGRCVRLMDPRPAMSAPMQAARDRLTGPSAPPASSDAPLWPQDGQSLAEHIEGWRTPAASPGRVLPPPGPAPTPHTPSGSRPTTRAGAVGSDGYREHLQARADRAQQIADTAPGALDNPATVVDERAQGRRAGHVAHGAAAADRTAAAHQAGTAGAASFPSPVAPHPPATTPQATPPTHATPPQPGVRQGPRPGR